MLAKITLIPLFCFCLSLAARADTTAPDSPFTIPRAPLWSHTPNVVDGPDTDTDPTIPTIDSYILAGANIPGPAVIIFPGGGYTHLSTTREGKDIATFFNAHQINAFVVRYRHAPRYHDFIPLQDAQRAVRFVRSKADEYHLDIHRIGVIGFSAGGHLAATLATEPDAPKSDAPDPIDRLSARPDFAILLYPVITLVDTAHAHMGSRKALIGDDEKLAQQLSAETRVTKDTPPIFLAHAATDKTVPVENSIMFFEACHKAGVPAEMHIFPSGPHGFGLAAANPVLNTWPDLMLHWMSINHWLTAPNVSNAPVH